MAEPADPVKGPTLSGLQYKPMTEDKSKGLLTVTWEGQMKDVTVKVATVLEERREKWLGRAKQVITNLFFRKGMHFQTVGEKVYGIKNTELSKKDFKEIGKALGFKTGIFGNTVKEVLRHVIDGSKVNITPEQRRQAEEAIEGTNAMLAKGFGAGPAAAPSAAVTEKSVAGTQDYKTMFPNACTNSENGCKGLTFVHGGLCFEKEGFDAIVRKLKTIGSDRKVEEMVENPMYIDIGTEKSGVMYAVHVPANNYNTVMIDKIVYGDLDKEEVKKRYQVGALGLKGEGSKESLSFKYFNHVIEFKKP